MMTLAVVPGLLLGASAALVWHPCRLSTLGRWTRGIVLACAVVTFGAGLLS